MLAEVGGEKDGDGEEREPKRDRNKERAMSRREETENKLVLKTNPESERENQK